MNLQHFANGFKKAVAKHASPTRKLEIYARDQVDNKEESSQQILGGGFDYKLAFNNKKGSVVIDS